MGETPEMSRGYSGLFVGNSLQCRCGSTSRSAQRRADRVVHLYLMRVNLRRLAGMVMSVGSLLAEDYLPLLAPEGRRSKLEKEES